MRFTHIIFDFDGTLLDTYSGISASLNKALAEIGMVLEYEDHDIAGPPMVSTLMRLTGRDRDFCVDITNRFRRHYNETGRFQAAVYPGVPELLHTLRAAGARLYIATAKSETAAAAMARHFELDGFIDAISGASADYGRVHKLDILRYLLDNSAMDRGRTVMVGDRCFDLESAAELGISSLGVSYGYAPPGELEQYRPLAIAGSAEELGRLLQTL